MKTSVNVYVASVVAVLLLLSGSLMPTGLQADAPDGVQRLTLSSTGRSSVEGDPSTCAQRSILIDDFEDGALPLGTDANGISVGFFTFAGPGAAVSISTTLQTTNTVLQIDSSVPPGNFGGMIHNFENESVDTWLSQDWSSYLAISFWVYGTNSGSPLFLDIRENRNPGSVIEDAEVWTYNFNDNFSGWVRYEIPFNLFSRKDIGNGAPNDGLGLTEVHGWAFGSIGLTGTLFLDDIQLCGQATLPPLTAKFAQPQYSVNEGETAVLEITLNRPADAPVTVEYATAESTAQTDRQFTPVSGALVFAVDDQLRTIEIPTFADGKHTGDRRVVVNLYEDTVQLDFQRRAVLTIVDNDPADVRLVDDFEEFHPFTQAAGTVDLQIETIASGAGLAIPGQGAFEGILGAEFDTSGAAASFGRTFSRGQDWSRYDGLSFWFFGSNSGDTYQVQVLDNRSVDTGAVDPSQWELVWSDEFNDPAGTPPDPNIWQLERGDGALDETQGWGNSELQYYTDETANAFTDGTGNLVIRLDEVDTETSDLVCWYGTCEYTSARLNTRERLDFEYGRIEARIRVPDGPEGLLPTFWMLGTDVLDVGWPQAGEIDIGQYVSRLPNEIVGALQGPGYSGGNAFGNYYDLGAPVSDDYHTFTIEWRPDVVEWAIDGITYHQASAADLSPFDWVFNHPFFMILSSAMGGNFAGPVSGSMTFPQDTLVDYVRVYQAPDTAERFQAGFVDDFSGWKAIELPFEGFSRSGSQPAGAPDDGLTLNEIWGYRFLMPDDATGSFYLDRVYLWLGETSFADGFELVE